MDIIITDGFFIPSQKNLNPKVFIDTYASLVDLGVDDEKAYTYYNNMLAFCEENETFYIWKEVIDISSDDLINPNFRYPDNYINGGYDYSLKYYSFYEIKFLKAPANTSDGKTYVIVNGQWVEQPAVTMGGIDSTIVDVTQCTNLVQKSVHRYIYDIPALGEICLLPVLADEGKEILVSNVSKTILKVSASSGEFLSYLKTGVDIPIIEFPAESWFRARVMVYQTIAYFLIVEKGLLND